MSLRWPTGILVDVPVEAAGRRRLVGLEEESGCSFGVAARLAGEGLILKREFGLPVDTTLNIITAVSNNPTT